MTEIIYVLVMGFARACTWAANSTGFKICLGLVLLWILMPPLMWALIHVTGPVFNLVDSWWAFWL